MIYQKADQNKESKSRNSHDATYFHHCYHDLSISVTFYQQRVGYYNILSKSQTCFKFDIVV